MHKIDTRINRKNVLFISSTFPLDEKDIQVPWMTELVKRLSKRMNINIFAPAFKGSKSFSYFNIPVFRFRYAPSFLETLTHGEGALFKLRKSPWLFLIAFLYILFGSLSVIYIFKKSKYDVVHVNWPFPQGIFGVICKFINPSTKLILTFYGAELSLSKRIPFGKSLLRLVIQKADKVIAISNSTKGEVQEIKNIPVEVISFSSSVFVDEASTVASIKKDNRVKKILFVGRLIDRKGISYLINAMPKILSLVPSRLDIVGEGPLHNVLNKQIKKIRLQKNVFLHNKVSESRLKKFYHDCDIFVLPAVVDKWGDTEGLGVVLLEAMSFRKPVVASNVGGIRDIVRHGVTGLLVPQKDPNALSKAIISVFKDKNLKEKLSNGGYEHVVSKFSWNSILSQTLRAYGIE